MTHRLRLVMEPWPPNTGEACPASMDHRVRNGVYWAVSSDASGATYLNIMCHAPPATMAFPDSVKQAWNRRRDHVPPTMATFKDRKSLGKGKSGSVRLDFGGSRNLK